MDKRTIICPICNRSFEPKTPRTKYCSDECRKQGRKEKLAEWQNESGYLAKQRERMTKYRERVKVKKEIQQRASAKKRAANMKRQLTRSKNRRMAELKKLAESGDIAAKLELIELEKGNLCVEYWETFQAFDLQEAEKMGMNSTTTVDEISVYRPDFAKAVVQRIEEEGSVIVYNGMTKRQ